MGLCWYWCPVNCYIHFLAKIFPERKNLFVESPSSARDFSSNFLSVVSPLSVVVSVANSQRSYHIDDVISLSAVCTHSVQQCKNVCLNFIKFYWLCIFHLELYTFLFNYFCGRSETLREREIEREYNKTVNCTTANCHLWLSLDAEPVIWNTLKREYAMEISTQRRICNENREAIKRKKGKLETFVNIFGEIGVELI